MVSKLYSGNEIINNARIKPNEVMISSGFTRKTNQTVLNEIVIKYIGEKYFYYDDRWILTPKNAKRNEGFAVYDGDEIIKGVMIRPNKIMFDSMTYRSAYDEILNRIIGKKEFYHRGHGQMCMYGVSNPDDYKVSHKRKYRLIRK